MRDLKQVKLSEDIKKQSTVQTKIVLLKGSAGFELVTEQASNKYSKTGRLIKSTYNRYDDTVHYGLP